MIFASAVFLLSSCGKQLQGYSMKQAQNTHTQLALCFIFSHKSDESEPVAVAKSKCRYFLSLLMEENIVYHWPKGSSCDSFVTWSALKKNQLHSAR